MAQQTHQNSLKTTIIITNYNYQDYVEQCIESCLQQTYQNIEIIVVDDGSSDRSLEILNSFSQKIQVISQENTGMVEASNRGFEFATGDIVMFLDADDYLKETAIESVVSVWNESTVKVHFRLEKMNNDGENLGQVPKSKFQLSSGDVWSEIINTGDYHSVPTSGNVYAKSLLDSIFPIKDAQFGSGNSYLDKIPTDAYLKYRVPFFGEIKAIQDIKGVYRVHGNNNGVSKSPYFNVKKRLRILNIAKLNTAFVEKKTNHRNFTGFYKRTKVIRLSAISYRIEGEDIVWNKSNRISLFIKLFKLLLGQKVNLLSQIYNVQLVFFILFLPKESMQKLLMKKFSKDRS